MLLMAQDIAERIEFLTNESQSLYDMHRAATRALDSTRGGGWGTFRVDYITEEQAHALPSYIGTYVGERLPILFYDDEDKLRKGGGFRVDERHTRFSVVRSFENESIGAQSHFLRWDRELWDPSATSLDEKEESPKEAPLEIKHRNKLATALVGIACGVALSAEATGFAMMMKGTFDAGQLRQTGASEAEIDEAIHNSDKGAELMLSTALAAGTAMTGYLILKLKFENEEDEPR